MASPSSVLTHGLGSWGAASLLITLGRGIGAADETPITRATEYIVIHGTPSGFREVSAVGGFREVKATGGFREVGR